MAVTNSELQRDMGRRVDALIKLGGSSRKDLAQYLGTTPNNIGHKLANVRGRSLSAWEALATAEFFGVSVAVLYGEEALPRQVTVASSELCS